MAWGGSRLAHPDDVLKQALAADPKPAVLITGGVDRAGVEPWYVERAMAALASAALGDAPPDFNLDRLRAEEASAEIVIGKAETMPVMAKRRVVAVSDVDKWRPADQERMVKWLERPADTTVLLFSSVRLDRRYAFAKTLEALPQVWRFRKLETDELVRALGAAAKKAGKRLSPDAAQEMIERAGEDYRLLLVELDKLIAFTGDKPDIDEEDVAAATAGAGQSDVFEWADALGRGDLSRALERLQIVLDAGSSAFELIGGLAWHFRTMLKAKAGGAPMMGRRMEAIASAARAFPTRALLAAHREIYRADVSLKAAQGPTGLKDDAVMDRLTRRICALRTS